MTTSEDRVAAIERQVRREALHPDAGHRAEARAERLEAEAREWRAYVERMMALQDERISALTGMVEALAAALHARAH